VVVTAAFLRLIIEMVDLLLVCWYDIKHETLIPCPHCAVSTGKNENLNHISPSLGKRVANCHFEPNLGWLLVHYGPDNYAITSNPKGIAF